MASGIVFNVQRFSLHDGPGIRTTVFLKGCPLRCPWCCNPESQSPGIQAAADGTVYGREVAPDGLVAELLRDEPFYRESGGGVTLSGGEPLFQHRFAMALLDALGRARVHTAIETAGFASADVFRRALALVDEVIMDIKHHDGQRHLALTGAPLERILTNLRAAIASGKDLLVRIPVVPGYNDSAADAEGFARLLRREGVRRVELLPFHQLGEKKYELLNMPYALKDVPPLHAADLSSFRAALEHDGIETLCGGR